ncbi:regulatory LuxR family protein [Thermasporomyces composti]|uniref:Regulatory LuxR family protein n=1 Tax=Thermasporomyces composti TaxID=696763 RepID=A0A3D9V2Y4_THECX|nr:regulatory LuxR family protein [Thermasporomyces composti]
MSDLSHGVVRALRPAGVANEQSYSPPAPTTTTSHTAANNNSTNINNLNNNHGNASDLRRRVTDDEIRLLALLADGLPVEAIARRLALSDRTVRRRSRALCDRLGARAPIQVVAWAARNGLI